MTRVRQTLSDGWRFTNDLASIQASVAWTEMERNLLGFEPEKDELDGVTWSKAGKCYGPAAMDYLDEGWREVRVPHDWCVEERPRRDAPIRNGFLPTGVAWYRREIEVPEAWKGQRIALRFDGVFRQASVFVNGHLVATNASGYIGFEAAVDAVLEYGARNVVAVRVDARSKEGWFYEGCGIYRPVTLEVTHPVHLVTDGVGIAARVAEDSGRVGVTTEVAHDLDDDQAVEVEQCVLDPEGREVGGCRISDRLLVAAGRCATLRQDVRVPNPELWSLDAPRLYRLRTRVVCAGEVVDEIEQTFGFRVVEFDAQEGFRLNGESMKLKGVCCHQDHAGVGSAVPTTLAVWRLEQLKSMGVNAYRCGHHPPAREILDACDRLGMLVIDEARCVGISDEHLSQAVRMVRRDRHHPCVIAWSLANEEMAVQCTEQGAAIFARTKRVLKALDDTRPFTAAINNGWDLPEGFIRHEDLHGLNYLNQGDLNKMREIAPEMPVILSEAASAVSTRGAYEDDPLMGEVQSYDLHHELDHPGVKMWPFWGRAAEASWRVVAETDWLAGTFVWTGFDYRGEQSPYLRWPSVGSHFGIMDMCGFPKDVFWYYKAWWSEETVLHVMPHWNWAGREGELIDVWLYSNAASVDLEINGKSVGEQAMPTNGHLSWSVPYEPGVLRAIGRWADGTTRITERVTTEQATQIRLKPCKPVLDLERDGLIIVEVAVTDSAGRDVPTAMHPVRFELTGEAQIVGIGNGNPNDHTAGRPNVKVAHIPVFYGLAQVLVQRLPGGGEDPIDLTARSPGLCPASLRL